MVTSPGNRLRRRQRLRLSCVIDLSGHETGYNWQMGNWVLGLEGDFDGASINRYAASPFQGLPARPPVQRDGQRGFGDQQN